jgi:hypothetical protein
MLLANRFSVFIHQILRSLNYGLMRMNIMRPHTFACGMMNVYPGLNRSNGLFHITNAMHADRILPNANTLLSTVFTWYPTPVTLFICYPITWRLQDLARSAYTSTRGKDLMRAVPKLFLPRPEQILCMVPDPIRDGEMRLP